MSVLVGRNRELRLLETALNSASEGRGGCFLLTGEAGIGKSRLVDELKHRAASDQFTILQGSCFEQDASFPYAPWIDALRASFASLNGTEIKEILGPLAPEFMKLLPELALLIPQIQPSPPLEPLAEKHRLFESVAQLGTSLTTSKPLLLILEDLHWSDEPSLELLQFFVRRSLRRPVLVIGTYRSEETSSRVSHHLAELMREHLAEKIQLTPLIREDVEQMMSAILQTEHHSAYLLDDLMRLTEGNPFFVEEILKGLGEAKDLDSVEVPLSIQDSVQRRVEQLPDSTRHLLSLAAVMGERFDFGLIREIAAQDEQLVLRMLKELIAAQLIVEQSADQFAFRHALTREAVYATLLQRERKAMHRTIGETIERLAGTRADAHVAQSAYHFYQGEVWQKAMKYSQRAGEKAEALYSPREAIVHFTHALDAAQQLGILPPLISVRGRAQAYEILGEFGRAQADYEMALASARREENPVDEWRLLIDLGLLWQSRDLKRAGEHYQRALALARNLQDESFVALTLNRVGNWNMNRGRTRDALPFHREALELFRKLDDRRGLAQTLDLLGLASYPLGEAIQGAAYLEQAVSILRKLDDREALVNGLINLALRTIMETEVLGPINFMQLTDASAEARQIARGFHWYQGEALALLQGALSLKQTGEYGQALERLAEAQLLVNESQDGESLARLHLIYGHIFTGLLALTEAREHIEAGLTQVQELGSGLLIPGATAGLASVALLQNDLARAQALLAPLFRSESPNGEEPFPLRKCWGVRAELELLAGRPGRALDIVDRLLAFTPNLAEYGPHAVPYLSRLRAVALTSLRRMDEAESELKGTLPVAQAQGQLPVVWRLHIDLGRVYRSLGRRENAEREFASARSIIQELANNTPEGTLRDNFLLHALAMLPSPRVQTPRQAAKKEFSGLTAREREIAALIAQGKSNREIADKLVIGENTAERHVANILSKLGLNSRTQIAVWALKKGFGK